MKKGRNWEERNEVPKHLALQNTYLLLNTLRPGHRSFSIFRRAGSPPSKALGSLPESESLRSRKAAWRAGSLGTLFLSSQAQSPLSAYQFLMLCYTFNEFLEGWKPTLQSYFGSGRLNALKYDRSFWIRPGVFKLISVGLPRASMMIPTVPSIRLVV